jgi:hypothetical protein
MNERERSGWIDLEPCIRKQHPLVPPLQSPIHARTHLMASCALGLGSSYAHLRFRHSSPSSPWFCIASFANSQLVRSRYRTKAIDRLWVMGVYVCMRVVVVVVVGERMEKGVRGGGCRWFKRVSTLRHSYIARS